VTVRLPADLQLSDIPKPGHWQAPGFSLEWEVRSDESEWTLTRTWRVQAGLVRGQALTEAWSLLRLADRLDRQRLHFETPP
jgi:hypothetical protein